MLGSPSAAEGNDLLPIGIGWSVCIDDLGTDRLTRQGAPTSQADEEPWLRADAIVMMILSTGGKQGASITEMEQACSIRVGFSAPVAAYTELYRHRPQPLEENADEPLKHIFTRDARLSPYYTTNCSKMY
jgi:hypothetical protein